jgi:chemotaxis protein histidine kinase CheA
MPDENDTQNLDDQILNRMMQDFLEEAREHLDQLNLNLIQLEGDPEEENIIDQIFRTAHTLKGSAAFAGLKEVSDIARKMEELFGKVRKGSFKVTASMIDVLYEGLDILAELIDRVSADESSEIDVSRILEKLEKAPETTFSEVEDIPDQQELDFTNSQELLEIYKKSYDQLAALKHLVYSSVHLSDLESLALLFSKQIDKSMTPERNAFWLVEDNQRVVEIARDGKLMEKADRRVLEIESSDVIKRVIHDQLVVWPSSLPKVKEMLPGFESPTIFPIKAQPQAFGFMVLDPEESAEVELYQFIGQFASMILKISKLHHTVEEQRQDLDEMTGILFKQNAQLSSLYHVGLDLMNVTDPVDLCRIIAEAAVNDLEAKRAAAFLFDESSSELIGAAQSGGLEGIESIRCPIDSIAPIKQSFESGRIITFRDFPEDFLLGANLLEEWLVVCFKGKERTQGVLVVEVKDEDIGDPISILANYSGILLDNLMLQRKVG